MRKELTVALNHERLDHIMTDHFEIGVANPMANVRARARKEVVEDGDFVAEEHQSVHEVRANKPSTTSDKDAFALRRRQEFDRRKTAEGRVGDGVGVGVVDRLGLVHVCVPASEEVILVVYLNDRLLDLILPILRCRRLGRVDIMRAEVEGAECAEGDLRVEAEAVETDGCDFLAVLVDSRAVEGEESAV